MTEFHPDSPRRRAGVSPVLIALAVAFFGVMAMLIVDHGPWSRPRIHNAIHTAAATDYSTTAAAARAAGATVTPTPPPLQLEPAAPGPQPAMPANPRTP